LPPKPKNTFTSALTRYLKTPYDEKTDFFHTVYPKGRDTLFLQLSIPQQLTTTQKRPKPSRLTQNYPPPHPTHDSIAPYLGPYRSLSCAQYDLQRVLLRFADKPQSG
jgi:hypothetical protein